MSRATLSWLSEGKPSQASASLIGNVSAGSWAARIGGKEVEPGQSVLLLPGGQCLPITPSESEPLLEVEVWRGTFPNGQSCVIRVYRPYGSQTVDRVCSFEDGVEFGRVIGEGQGAGKGWNVREESERGSRRFEVAAGEEVGTYRLEIDGQASEALLERSYRGDWSAGDEVPE